jgi:hypothetical protein
MSMDRIRESGADADAPGSGAGQGARSDEPAGVDPGVGGDAPSDLDGSAGMNGAPRDDLGTDADPEGDPASDDSRDQPTDAGPEADPAGADQPGRPAAESSDAPAPDRADEEPADAGIPEDAGRPATGGGAEPAPGGLPAAASPEQDEDARASSAPAPQATGSRVPAVSEPAVTVAVPVVPGSPTMSNTNARLAHVHVATGMYGLARAELETLAARGALDVPALADLAEVRWRTGDLVGAGEAADAHLQAGGDELIAICVAAEAANAAGRSADARNLAARVLARGRSRLDDLFAGQPRGAIWPPAAVSERSSPGAPSVGPGARQPAPALTAPSMSGDLAEIQVRLDGGEFAAAATRLALLLRTRPVLAPAILSVADQALQADPPAQEVAALHLVRGDAYRLMGRESLAAEAFQQSTRALGARPSEEKP